MDVNAVSIGISDVIAAFGVIVTWTTSARRGAVKELRQMISDLQIENARLREQMVSLEKMYEQKSSNCNREIERLMNKIVKLQQVLIKHGLDIPLEEGGEL